VSVQSYGGQEAWLRVTLDRDKKWGDGRWGWGWRNIPGHCAGQRLPWGPFPPSVRPHISAFRDCSGM
jgi:hypothetical protein